jgi:hypothetical protein
VFLTLCTFGWMFVLVWLLAPCALCVFADTIDPRTSIRVAAITNAPMVFNDNIRVRIGVLITWHTARWV